AIAAHEPDKLRGWGGVLESEIKRARLGARELLDAEEVEAVTELLAVRGDGQQQLVVGSVVLDDDDVVVRVVQLGERIERVDDDVRRLRSHGDVQGYFRVTGAVCRGKWL